MCNIDTSDAHATAIGRFYRIANDYTEGFKIGGKQKLQKLIGEDLFYKKGKEWWWNNPKIIRMTTSELENLTAKIKRA